MSEFFHHVLPKWFLEGKNKKLLNKKLHQFVAFNKFETFNRVTMLDRLRMNEIKWLHYKAQDKNAKFFRNENEFVLWRVLKWIFEDISIALIRCYFYSTERAKEYSRIFYYRKPIWSVIMRYAIDDLEKQNLKYA